MEALIPRYQFIRKSQPLHHSSLLQPEYRAERPAEEYAFYCCECNQSLCEFVIVVNKFHCPISFFSDGIEIAYCIEKKVFFFLVFDVCVDQKGLRFGVYVLHRHLEALKHPCFRYFNLFAKCFG